MGAFLPGVLSGLPCHTVCLWGLLELLRMTVELLMLLMLMLLMLLLVLLLQLVLPLLCL